MKLAYFITHLARAVTPLGEGVRVYLHASLSPAYSSFTCWLFFSPVPILAPTLVGTKGGSLSFLGHRATISHIPAPLINLLGVRPGVPGGREPRVCARTPAQSHAALKAKTPSL